MRLSGTQKRIIRDVLTDRLISTEASIRELKNAGYNEDEEAVVCERKTAEDLNEIINGIMR